MAKKPLTFGNVQAAIDTLSEEGRLFKAHPLLWARVRGKSGGYYLTDQHHNNLYPLDGTTRSLREVDAFIQGVLTMELAYA